jgi:hypothetical protein
VWRIRNFAHGAWLLAGTRPGRAKLPPLCVPAELPRQENGPYVPLAATDIFVAIQKPWQRIRAAVGPQPMSAFMTFGSASPRSPCRGHGCGNCGAGVPSAATACISSAWCSGTRQARTTERYAHLKEDPLRAVANRTSERIAAIMQGSKGTKVVPLPSPKVAE